MELNLRSRSHTFVSGLLGWTGIEGTFLSNSMLK
jgi:hypothetical protein